MARCGWKTSSRPFVGTCARPARHRGPLADTCQPSTVATRLRGVRRFCRWIVVEGEVDKAPTEGIEIATAPDKPVPILTDPEITALPRRAPSAADVPERSLARSSSADATR